MKAATAILGLLAIAMLVLAGCAKESSTTGYATYSGGDQGAPAGGGGGCGRFAAAETGDLCGETLEAGEAAGNADAL